jgi:oxygen-independent coproporphyrinogen-3 oxidase
MRRLHDTFTIDGSAEITLETNPGTVTQERLAAYRSLGVNRLSIGIQSFRREELHFLSRIHDAGQAVACFEMARRAGFDNLSIDLMYSLPGQTQSQWGDTLRRALTLAPEHISAYSLIVEDNTPLARMVAARQVSPNPVETEAALYEYSMSVMEENGFEHYEVSNYAKPGRRSRHNYAYWSHKNYLGLGPSAHAFWRDGGWASATRWANVANIAAYIERLGRGESPVAFREEILARQLKNERIFLGLRTDGLNMRSYHEDFGACLPADRLLLAEALVRDGRAVNEGETLRLTARGFLVCDEIAARMMI